MEDDAANFTEALVWLVFADAAATFGADALKAAGEFSDTAVAIIGSGVDGLAVKLIVAPTNGQSALSVCQWLVRSLGDSAAMFMRSCCGLQRHGGKGVAIRQRG